MNRNLSLKFQEIVFTISKGKMILFPTEMSETYSLADRRVTHRSSKVI